MKTKQHQPIEFGWKIVVATFAVMFLSGLKGNAQSIDLDEVRDRLPETITRLTDEQLKKSVPKSYFFRYRANPEPGTRKWRRIDDNTWHEIYPSGRISIFRVLGHTTINGISGTIVINVGDGANDVFLTKSGKLRLQAFIPDKGSRKMRHFYRNTGRGDTNWNDLAPMRWVR